MTKYLILNAVDVGITFSWATGLSMVLALIIINIIPATSKDYLSKKTNNRIFKAILCIGILFVLLIALKIIINSNN